MTVNAIYETVQLTEINWLLSLTAFCSAKEKLQHSDTRGFILPAQVLRLSCYLLFTFSALLPRAFVFSVPNMEGKVKTSSYKNLNIHN